MGVTGLWTVVQPCARPIKIETLNKKRLAVDASIWIYQFLKAVRDKEGNALRNSHVVGFFRRICKLLFIGIKPVFVFDGGAPVLKRQTVSGRKARREGRREDAVRTAGKLLAVQMQRRAEEEEQKRREERVTPRRQELEEEIPENPIYVDELLMTVAERQQNRTFRKKDAYHLPNLDVDLADMGAPNDPRIMSHEELEEYARQFHTGEDVNVYDFSKIDFESPFFLSLPASDRYNILNAARLRSRLRMGYSKEQLDTMFPNRMDFSRFQIERVKERNELTQRLMNINGMNGEDVMFGINNGGRVAGEKGKEYVLVKNDGVEGGWALGVVSNKGEGERSKPIDVEGLGTKEEYQEDEDGEGEDEGFEDVPIEGLNRLPKRHARARALDGEVVPFDSEELAKRRRAIYEARMEASGQKQQDYVSEHIESGEPDSLFVPQMDKEAEEDQDLDALFEDVPAPTEEEDDELKLAIAMSLENNNEAAGSSNEMELPSFSASTAAGPRIDRPLEFNQKNAKVGRDFAHLTNTRAHELAPKPFAEDSDEDGFNLQAALEESRHTKHSPRESPRVHSLKRTDPPKQKFEGQSVDQLPHAIMPTSKLSATASGFDGPLPFESINLGKSILGKRRKPAEEPAGGFEKDVSEEKRAQPLPPWFSGDIREEVEKQKAIEEQQFERGDPDRDTRPLSVHTLLRRQGTGEVIDLEVPKERSDETIVVESSDGADGDDVVMGEARSVDPELRMGDVADLTRAKAPKSDMPPNNTQPADDATKNVGSKVETTYIKAGNPFQSSSPKGASAKHTPTDNSDSEARIEWSESEAEDSQIEATNGPRYPTLVDGRLHKDAIPSTTPEFEYVRATESPRRPQSFQSTPLEAALPIPSLLEDESTNGRAFESLEAEEEDDYSDPEDEELMRQLAVEAEEHARFASSLNQRSQLQTAEDYEKELRQLRNQQKKDRRDADEVTHIMVTECQQLLKLFGLPYITAPMEAEAQCAALVSMGLVDGIVTDDSDIFLFGGTRVYKNMFNQAKFVECYLASDLEKEYSLTREKLIRFAHLLGSDYTEGLPSVGPVTALEILSEFDTLEEFVEWWSSVQMAQKPSAEDNASSFRRKFRKNAAKLFLPNTFPDTRVDYAYMHPEIDKDPEPFQWGVPNLDALRSFLMATIGWSQERTDEVLVPVIKDMNRRENEGTQANITQFFGGAVGIGSREHAASNGNDGGAFAPRRRVEGKSKRMESALGRLHARAKGGNVDEGDVTSTSIAAAQPTAKESINVHSKLTATPRNLKVKKRAAPATRLDKDGHNDASDCDDDGDTEYQAPAKVRKGANGAKRRKRGRNTA
ncbi:MAG: hypothetical protein Q9217_003513 [Psora testacea]